jgi:hypothetical protein
MIFFLLSYYSKPRTSSEMLIMYTGNMKYCGSSILSYIVFFYLIVILFKVYLNADHVLDKSKFHILNGTHCEWPVTL